MTTYDLWAYIAPVVAPGQLAGRPVGVTHTPGGDAIFQAQFDAPDSRRVLHVKGVLGVPADFEELFVEGDYIYRAIDTSRPAKDGGPYTLHDTPNGRGSRWAKRHMAAGDVFERNPFVSAFDMRTGLRTKTDGPVRTWLKLAAHHDHWRGVADVLELWWLTDSPTQTEAKERYYYGKGLGLVGFEGPGLKTYPNHVWDKLPPAPLVPVLTRKALGFALPALPAETGLRFVNPARYPHTVYSPFGWRDSPGKPGERDLHSGVDLTPGGGGPYPVHAALAGTVTFAGWNDAGYGNLVKLAHDDGLETLYAHLSRIDAQLGQQVTTDTRLGEAGATGWATGVHLHFEVRRDGKAFDPLPHLDPPESAPPVAAPPPSTPEPEPPPVEEPDVPPPFEVEFNTIAEKNAAGLALIALGQRIVDWPGRRIEVVVRTK